MGRSTLFLLCLLCLSGGLRASPEEEKESDTERAPPNIVFILADDFGWYDVGYNNPEVKSPNIDRLAAEGIKLDQSYAQAWCSPSRAALLSGYYPYHIGRQTFVISTVSTGGLDTNVKLMPEYLSELGYASHIVGKWHLGNCNEAYLPTSRGFDSQYGFYSSFINNFDHIINANPNLYDFQQNDQPLKNPQMAADYAGDLLWTQAYNVITNHAEEEGLDKPLFLYLALPHTHFPVEAPAEYFDRYPDADDSEKRRSFLAMVSHMDDIVGNVTATLKETGMYDNSIIVFMADNGALEGRWAWLPWWGGGDNGPLRGQKSEYFEGGVRVPGFVHSPLIKNKGRTADNIIHITDWLPTLLEAAGANEEIFPELADIDGISQYDTLFNWWGKPKRFEMVYNLQPVPPNGEIVGAIRYGPYKLLNFVGGREGAPFPLPAPFELYNLNTDPYEENNIIDSWPWLSEFLIARFYELASDMVPPNGMGLVPDEELGAVVVDNLGFIRTDYCELDGTYNRFEYP